MLLNWVITKGQNPEYGSSRSLRLLYFDSVQSKMKIICSSTNQKICWDAQMTDSSIFMFQFRYCSVAYFITLKSKFAVSLHNRFFDVVVHALFYCIIPFGCKNSLLLSSVCQLGICGLLCRRTGFFTQSNL